MTKSTPKKSPTKAKHRPKKKATKKKATKAAAPPQPEVPEWGPSIQLGTIHGRAVTISEPLNEAAMQALTAEQSLLLVMSDTIRKMETAMGTLQAAVGQLQHEQDLSRRLAQVEAVTDVLRRASE